MPRAFHIVCLVLFVALAVAVFFMASDKISVFAPKEVSAGSSHNVFGWAWSSNIGWISMNSIGCDANNNGFVDSGACGGNDTSTVAFDYGVNVNSTTGNFSGYAWSPNIGWTKFDPTTTPPGETGAAPVRLDLASNQISGWARACGAVLDKVTCEGTEDPLAGGWDGWIKFRDTAPVSYGVDRNPVTQELEGWAWGSAVVGWISFNCSNDSSCATIDYSAEIDLNAAPEVKNMQADPATSAEYCGFTAYPPVRVRWTFYDPPAGTQSAFRIQVKDGAVVVVDTGQKMGSSMQYVFQSAGEQLGWDKTYTWQVMVWDNDGQNSGWVSGGSFATPLHHYPDPSFNWSPASPITGQLVSFTDATTFAATSIGKNWAWDFDNNGTTDSTLQNPSYTFSSSGLQTVKLTSGDNVGSCSASRTLITISSSSVPIWREVSPF
ncbi:MAG: PKD domain-containing protein [Candidatus Wildermuthbacteria bacterium]|nr:PKD domain-containing protein [Candidatus Wildermuthbacteria bacterium]